MRNNFSISNTDIVTMLMVKKTEELQAEKEALKKEHKEILEKTIVSIDKDMAKVRTKCEPYLEAVRNLLRVFYPKTGHKVYVDLDFGIFDLPLRRNNEGHYDVILNFQLIPIEVETEVCNTNDSEYAYDLAFSQIPISFKKTYKLPKRFTEVLDRMGQIDYMLRDKQNLQEKIVAKLTESALLQNSELKLLSDKVLVDI